MTPPEAVPIRKYRSRKQKPCDNCRRRRVCCVRDAEGDCALCSRRSIPCTFSSAPARRAQRSKAGSASQAAIQSVDTPPTSHSTSKPATAVLPLTPEAASNKTHSVGRRRDDGEGNYVGLTGTEDVYFDVRQDQVIGNDPAKEAYFRVSIHHNNYQWLD